MFFKSIILTVFLCVFSQTVGANGLASLHSQGYVNGKHCFISHSHHGSGYSRYSRREALRDAIRRWSSFTSLEYSRSWGSYSYAWRKREKCTIGNRGGWRCHVKARPCKY